METLNASTVFAFERPFLAFLSPPTPFSRGTRPLSSKYSNHSSMETQAGLYLVSQRPCEGSWPYRPFLMLTWCKWKVNLRIMETRCIHEECEQNINKKSGGSVLLWWQGNDIGSVIWVSLPSLPQSTIAVEFWSEIVLNTDQLQGCVCVFA